MSIQNILDIMQSAMIVLLAVNIYILSKQYDAFVEALNRPSTVSDKLKDLFTKNHKGVTKP